MIQEEILDKDKHIELLIEVNKALAEKLSFMNKRIMQKNDEQAIKWRNKAFYWKRKYLECLERLVTLGGIAPALTKEREDERTVRSVDAQTS